MRLGQNQRRNRNGFKAGQKEGSPQRSGRQIKEGNGGSLKRGRGLVAHLDEIGSQQGYAQLIQYLKNLRIHYTEDKRRTGGGRGSRVILRDPFHPDTDARIG